jgi:plastocyanin
MGGTGRRWIAAGLLVGAFALGACGGDDEGGAEEGPTGGGDGGAGGGTSITIEGFAFSPSTVQVSGETTLTITNEDGATHTFTLDDGSVDEEVASGASVEVTVNPSETTGFHCAIHPQMTGTLEVA